MAAVERLLDDVDRFVTECREPVEDPRLDAAPVVAELRVGVPEVERPVRAVPTERVVVNPLAVFLDSSAPVGVEWLVEELDDLTYVALLADVAREDDDVYFTQQVRRDALLDDAVDERLDVRRVGRSEDAMARIRSISISRWNRLV